MRWIPWALALAALLYLLWYLLRALGRAGGRAGARMARARREEAWREQPGASPARPIVVDSASVIEPQAETSRCPVCEHSLRVLQHAAQTRAGLRLRVVSLRCDACGRERELFFQLRSSPPTDT